MSENNYHLDHARHNNDALKYLDKSPDFLDWVITMCFYASLHIVKSKIFPLSMKASSSDGVKTFKLKSFDEYLSHTSRQPGNPHQKLSDLVNNNCSEVASDYDQLKDLCWTARYNNYIVDRDLSNLAKQLKERIMMHCDSEFKTYKKADKKK